MTATLLTALGTGTARAARATRLVALMATTTAATISVVAVVAIVEGRVAAIRLATFAGFLRRALGAIALGSGLGGGRIHRGWRRSRSLGSRRGALDRRGRRYIQLRLLLRSGGFGRCGRLAWCSGAGLCHRLRLGALGVGSFFAFDIRHGQTSCGAPLVTQGG